ncbi:hypothetical protein RRG08_016694 [Elysia crispata]|uniref:Uncharacterized protein n=1 Tax=Elysia crispata TaxID=231223 RepID=A0AAE1AIV0_9GAST|nr:hypothetical protein RRG08_016694 [Elysia crispata]
MDTAFYHDFLCKRPHELLTSRFLRSHQASLQARNQALSATLNPGPVKKSNFSSQLAEVERMCLWSCRSSHFRGPGVNGSPQWPGDRAGIRVAWTRQNLYHPIRWKDEMTAGSLRVEGSTL